MSPPTAFCSSASVKVSPLPGRRSRASPSAGTRMAISMHHRLPGVALVCRGVVLGVPLQLEDLAARLARVLLALVAGAEARAKAPIDERFDATVVHQRRSNIETRPSGRRRSGPMS